MARDRFVILENVNETAVLYGIDLPGYLSRVRVDFDVENLFDTLCDLPTGGAYVGQGTTMGLNSIPWGIAVPGLGRTSTRASPTTSELSRIRRGQNHSRAQNNTLTPWLPAILKFRK
jgi:hypothetical protein